MCHELQFLQKHVWWSGNAVLDLCHQFLCYKNTWRRERYFRLSSDFNIFVGKYLAADLQVTVLYVSNVSHAIAVLQEVKKLANLRLSGAGDAQLRVRLLFYFVCFSFHLACAHARNESEWNWMGVHDNCILIIFKVFGILLNVSDVFLELLDFCVRTCSWLFW